MSEISSRSNTQGIVRPGQSRGQFFIVSLVSSAVYIATILSFPQYYVFNPFAASGLTGLAILQSLSLLGYGLLTAVPPILLRPTNKVWRSIDTLTLIVVLAIHPIATLGIKIYGILTFGQLWTEYLIAFPILFLVETVLPGIYLAIALKMNKSSEIR